jgi:hypothetical protein
VLGDGRRDPLDALAGLPVPLRLHCCPGEFGPDGWQEHCGQGAA